MDTEKLISELGKDAAPVRRLRPPPVRAAMWAAIALFVITVMVFPLGGLRPNLDLALGKPGFLIENLFVFMAGVCATIAAFRLGVPDTRLRKSTLALIGFSTLVWLYLNVVTLAGAEQAGLSTALGGAGSHCVMLLTALVGFPVALLFAMIRRAAPAFPGWAGYSGFIAATSFGALAMRYICGTDAFEHLFVWHFMPVAVFAVCGILLGRLLFRW